MPKQFNPPTGIKQWWEAPHCGSGSTNTAGVCGFCGDPVLDCAKRFSAFLRNASPEDLEDMNKHTWGGHSKKHDYPCGGCGFWCSGCGRFWAEDSCGEASPDMYSAADGAELETREDNFVYCVCGKMVASNASCLEDEEGEKD